MCQTVTELQPWSLVLNRNAETELWVKLKRVAFIALPGKGPQWADALKLRGPLWRL